MVYSPKSVSVLVIVQKACHQKPVLQGPPKKEVPVGLHDAIVVAILAISQLLASSKCNFCKLTRHLEAVRQKKAHSKTQGVKWIDVLEMVKAAPCCNSEAPKLQVPIHINRKAFTLELDTAAGGNFIST